MAGAAGGAPGLKFMRSKLAISAFVLALMALHLVPIVQEMRTGGQALWPIMAWGMYRHAHRPPVTATSWEIIAETAGGERWEVGPHDAGQGPSGFGTLYVEPLAGGDSTAALRLGQILNRAREDRVARLVVEEATYRVTDEGVVATPGTPITYRLEE